MLSLVISGMLVGIALSLTGAGGGIIALPLLIHCAGLEPFEAAPIALISVGLAAAVGAMLGLREGVVRYRAATVVGLSGMAVSPCFVWLAQRAPPVALVVGLIIALLCSAQAMYRRSMARTAKEIGAAEVPCQLDPKTGKFVWNAACVRVMMSIGIGSGALSGLLGVGGGFFIVPAFSRLTGLPAQSIVATSQAIIALVSASAVIAFCTQSSLRWDVALPFAGAAMLALAAARAHASRLPATWVARAFAALCVGIAIGLSVELFHG